ncbi:MAG: hypothetical protein ACLQVX_01965 [Limisphaerales bacterium]
MTPNQAEDLAAGLIKTQHWHRSYACAPPKSCENRLMDLLDLVKATIFCGVMAFLCYSFPVLGQAMIIGFLALVWLGYVRRAIASLRRRRG